MKKEEFIKLYYIHSLSELKKILGCSIPTIYSRIDEYGIERKGRKVKKGKRKLNLE